MATRSKPWAWAELRGDTWEDYAKCVAWDAQRGLSGRAPKITVNDVAARILELTPGWSDDDRRRLLSSALDVARRWRDMAMRDRNDAIQRERAAESAINGLSLMLGPAPAEPVDPPPAEPEPEPAWGANVVALRRRP